MYKTQAREDEDQHDSMSAAECNSAKLLTDEGSDEGSRGRCYVAAPA